MPVNTEIKLDIVIKKLIDANNAFIFRMSSNYETFSAAIEDGLIFSGNIAELIHEILIVTSDSIAVSLNTDKKLQDSATESFYSK